MDDAEGSSDMSTLYGSLLAGLLLSGGMAAAMADCPAGPVGHASVRVSLREGAVQLAYALPEAVSCLRFKSGGSLRRLNWQIQGPGRLSGTGDTLQWDQPVRSFEVRIEPTALRDGQFDRTYTPVMPLGDGRALAVYTDYLLLDPALGRTTIEFEGLPARGGLMQAGLHQLSSEDPPGYLLLGHPVVERYGDDALIVDQSLPEPLIERVRSLLDQARRHLASVPRPGGPISILAMGGGRLGNPSWRGDVSPGLMRLGFYGQGWDDAQPALARRLSAYVLHETFHLHNLRLRPGSPGGVLLLEGGADAVAVGLQHRLGQLDDTAYLARQNLALRQCLLSSGTTVREKEALGGDVPYDCGFVLLSLASWAVSGTMLDDGQPIELWRAALTQAGDGPYDWREFLAVTRGRTPAQRQEVVDLLEQLVHSRIDWDTALSSPALQELLEPAPLQDYEMTEVSSQLGSRALMSLLASQCTGPYGFHMNDGIFTLDTAQGHCKPAWPDKFPVARLNGFDFVHQGWQAAQSARRSCTEQGQVLVADEPQARPFTMPCRDFGAVPRLYRFRAPALPLGAAR